MSFSAPLVTSVDTRSTFGRDPSVTNFKRWYKATCTSWSRLASCQRPLPPLATQEPPTPVHWVR